MPDNATAWMPREKWDALVRGEGCPLCAEIQSTETANLFGYTVADLRVSRLRLQTTQYVKGYCILISNTHVREPYELDPDDQHAFFQDMLQAGRALEAAFGATKMNFEILGNSVPHLHCHIQPRYYDDPAPGRPINPDAERRILTPDEYAERVDLIRRHLG
jgi:diadenosine tetraphosphate (Ap4A) HIT family hydrolase